MTEHKIKVDGATYRFEAHPYPTGPKMMIEAPGVVPFDVESIDEARDILRGVYSDKASQ